MKSRVVVTGLGLVCAAGNNIKSFSKNVIEGISCFSRVNDSRLEPEDIGAICCNLPNCHVKSALKKIFGSIDKKAVDVSSVIGYAESTIPLISLAYTLYDPKFEIDKNKNYILSVFSSPKGFNTSLIIKKGL